MTADDLHKLIRQMQREIDRLRRSATVRRKRTAVLNKSRNEWAAEAKRLGSKRTFTKKLKVTA